MQVYVLDVNTNAIIEVYTKFGAMSMKNWILVFGVDVIEKVFAYSKYCMSKQLGYSLPSTF
jgi:hypothetical protein